MQISLFCRSSANSLKDGLLSTFLGRHPVAARHFLSPSANPRPTTPCSDASRTAPDAPRTPI